jgi:hypothetical protein
MAINTLAIENFVDNIGQANNELNVNQLGLTRTVSKKFAKMLGGVKKKEVTLDNTKYTLTKEGAVSMITMFEEGDSLAPSYNENGVLEINNDKTADTVVIGGSFASTAPEQGKKKGSTVVTGKNIVITDANFGEYAYHTFAPADGGKVVLEGIAVDGSDGKLCAGKGPNTPLVFKSDGAVVIREMTETAGSDANAKPQLCYNSAIYNGLEIWGHQKADGTWGNPTSILIEDCNFVNSFSNNAINIFGMASGAKALIKNCVFDGASNILRIGSVNTGFANSYNCVIEFRDCQFKSWDTDKLWGSFALCQFDNDGSNIYGTDSNGTHITIKLVNCTGPDGQKIVAADPTKLFGSEVYVTTTVDNQEVVTKYAQGTQILVDGAMTDVSGQDMVDTQHRLMVLYGKLPGMSAKSSAISYADYTAYFPTFIVA